MKRKNYVIMSAIMMGIIFLFSSFNAEISSMQSGIILNFVNIFLPVNSFMIRKLAHFTLFFLLSVGVYLTTKNYIITILLVSLYAISDEVHQYFIPGRSCEIRDMIIDISGCLVSLITIKLWRYVNDKRTKNDGKNGK